MNSCFNNVKKGVQNFVNHVVKGSIIMSKNLRIFLIRVFAHPYLRWELTISGRRTVRRYQICTTQPKHLQISVVVVVPLYLPSADQPDHQAFSTAVAKKVQVLPILNRLRSPLDPKHISIYNRLYFLLFHVSLIIWLIDVSWAHSTPCSLFSDFDLGFAFDLLDGFLSLLGFFL